MASVANWLTEQRRVYFDNAPMVREYRSQLRGSKAPWILSFFLGLLVVMAIIVYAGITFGGERSVTAMQGALTGFFYAVLGMLEFLVALVAPVVASSSIIGEYERQSIELIFTSPMSAKYFLVGKLLSAYRYLAMLIFLALPIAAVAVVLGGATWKDVLSAFLLVSLHGLLYMAISLPIAVMSSKSVTTVLLSYAANFVWVNIFAVIGGMTLRSPSSANALIGLCPYFTGMAASASTDVFGHSVPIWLTTLVVTLLLVKLFVLGAGSALTQGGSKETVGLRLHGSIYTLLFGLLFGAGLLGSGTIPFTASPDWAAVFWPLTAPFVVCLPYLSTWSLNSGKKLFPNGWFNPKLIFRGSPASGLPYLLLTLVLLSVGLVCGGMLVGHRPVVSATPYVLGVFASWILAWALGRLASVFTIKQGPEAPKRLHLLFLFIVFLLPGILLWVGEAVLQSANVGYREGTLEHFYLFSFMGDLELEALIKALVTLSIAALIAIPAELGRRKATASVVST